MAKVNPDRIARQRYAMLPDDVKLAINDAAFALLRKHGFPTEGADVYGKAYDRLMAALKKARSTLYTRIEDHPDEHKMVIWSELVVNGRVRGKSEHLTVIVRNPSDDGGDEYGAEDTADTE